jgi:Mn2+/Fe2+ NRAMP family transporter
MQSNKTWRSVVIWSIISAAFIGPGTVTTALTAGSLFKLDLLWVVLMATLACLVLQEVAARIGISSGQNLGQALARKFGTTRGLVLSWGIGLIVIGGCAAYEAGNILGAVAGLSLLLGVDSPWLIVAISITACTVLWSGSPSWIFKLMMTLVVVMGIAFLRAAWMGDFTLLELVRGSLIPTIPSGGYMTLLGLMGTTIVPYNLFLASAAGSGQSVSMMRVGLTISIVFGGVITGVILVAGALIDNFSSFAGLFDVVDSIGGKWAAFAVALGLFSAGFSSAVTAPYASAIIVRTVFGVEDPHKLRLVRIGVLAIGFVVGIMGFKPVQVILSVQALNGLILPLMVVLLIILINDRSIVGPVHMHGRLYNVVLLLVLASVLVVSLGGVEKIFMGELSNSSNSSWVVYGVSIALCAVVGVSVLRIPRR